MPNRLKKLLGITLDRLETETVRAVVLAGGNGSRLWPLSRKQLPKQFLCLDKQHTMLEATVNRITPFCKAEDVVVVSSQEHASGEAYHVLEPYQLICEPTGRNTAPAIALAALYLQQQSDIDPIMLVLPADHIIQNIPAFHQVLEQAIVAATENHLVTFGIIPSHPDTGFGYIKAKAKTTEKLPDNAFVVEGFTEKPNLETAEGYLEQGDYYWNSGMFVWKASVLLEAIKKYLPEVHLVLEKIKHDYDNDIEFQEAVKTHFADMPSISIDYGVLEKITAEKNKLLVIPCDIEWDDVGSWDALHKISDKDDAENVIEGNVLALDCKNSLIKSQSRLVAAVGIDDVCLIETPDAILLTKRGETQRVKEIFDELQQRNAPEHLSNLTVRRPWGTYTIIEQQVGFKIKRIEVNSGASLSLQAHQHRSEHWVVVSGTATVTCNGKTSIVTKNQSTYIPIGEKHRLENRGKIPVQLVEVQVGDYLEEDDIERFDDVYHRN